MANARAKTGISKIALAILLVVVIAVAGAYIFLSSGGSTTTTPPPPSSSGSNGGPPTVQVRTGVNQLINNLNARNVDDLVTLYGPNAIEVWSGNTGGLSGRYMGPDNIKLIYATTIGKTSRVSVNVSQYAENTISPTNINTTYVLHMLANSSVAGTVNATINVSEAWSWGSGGWHISKENWAYLKYDSSLIDAGIPVSSTTFPQWRVMEGGGNPDLVSEKSFEWHAGPFVAASVYAFLVGVVAFMALKFGPMGRTRGSSLATTEEDRKV
ncbi:MAG: hypothetical protein OK455_09920 [Thaumarchaeota archaeon]|nr:hypothetical protein [Nitrososphaerota archaeon]